MNELTIFNNEQFGQLRTVVIDNEPWFVGKDICEMFGDKNPNRSMSRIDDLDRKFVQINTNGGKQTIVVVNESGLYALLFAMQPQKANKEGVSDAYPLETEERLTKLHNFKRWVTHEVLPSIRKTGSYIIGQEEMSREELLAKAHEAALQILAERERKISALTEANTALLKLTTDNAPKVAFADSVSETGGEILIGELAKLMHQNGIDIGQNRLYRELREDGYIMQNGTIPTQKGMEKGWFRIIERPVTIGNGQTILTQTTKVTVKGQVDLINKFYEKHIDDIF